MAALDQPSPEVGDLVGRRTGLLAPSAAQTANSRPVQKAAPRYLIAQGLDRRRHDAFFRLSSLTATRVVWFNKAYLTRQKLSSRIISWALFLWIEHRACLLMPCAPA